MTGAIGTFLAIIVGICQLVIFGPFVWNEVLSEHVALRVCHTHLTLGAGKYLITQMEIRYIVLYCFNVFLMGTSFFRKRDKNCLFLDECLAPARSSDFIANEHILSQELLLLIPTTISVGFF